ncbi:hypothetical protein FJZ28_03235 [Candidatus Peregrinibacteria bacterium]|nr:hypothetical protein [Candidatus Peregrinibacteria bacterium]
MFLLLAGSTDTARALIVDEFLTAHEDWKHLAMEDIREAEPEEDEDILGFKETFLTMVACECAMQAYKEGHRVIITCSELEMIENIRGELGKPITTVYLGTAEEGEDFDHTINGAEASMVEICKKLDGIIRKKTA